MAPQAAPAQELVCYVNGKKHILPSGRGEQTLLQYLRGVGLTGTKLGCGEGGCGACTVMVSSCEGGKLLHRSVNACLAPLYSVEGCHVVTVEGIGNGRSGLHPVQERLATMHGSQCGFCTPGFVMSMYSLLRGATGEITEEDIEEALSGNLCRCTGYRPILDAFRTFAKTNPAAYTEEAIAASKGLTPDGTLATNGAANGTGANGTGANGTGANGTGASGTGASATSVDSTGANGTGVNGAGTSGSICPSSGLPCDCNPANGGVSGPQVKAAEGRSICPSSGLPCDCKAGCGAHKGKGAGAAGANGTLPTAEPIFPPELKKRAVLPLHVPGPVLDWHRPTSLDQLLELKAAHPAARLIGGNTEVGIELKFKDAGYRQLVHVMHVPELTKVEVTDAGVSIGGSVTLTTLSHTFQALIKARPPYQSRGLQAVVQQLRWFAGNQIRNVAIVAGNICTASPISDLNPVWMAAGASFTLVGKGTGERTVPASEFFLAYRKVDMQPHEVLLRVNLPWTREHEFVKEFKQAPRREDDIAIVNAGMRLRVAPAAGGAAGGGGGWVIEEASFAFGGVAAKSVMAAGVAALVVGKPLEQDTLVAALAALPNDIQLADTAPGGKVEYRRSLAASFLFKFFVHVATKLEEEAGATFALDPAAKGAAAEFHRPPPRGVQYFAPAAPDAVVGQPLHHAAAKLQVTGDALYGDDIKLPADALHAALVMSTKPHARLVRVDASAALAMPGVAGYFDHTSIPAGGSNLIGPMVKDEEVFAVDTVQCVGAVIGVIVADSEATARRAAKAVQVQYEELPAYLSIEEAVEAGSFDPSYNAKIECGDVDAAWAQCDHIFEGDFKVGGQEHFYLEPNNCIVYPSENQEILTIASTQTPNKHQMLVALCLGLPAHKVVCKTKRIGGGFGGKETRAVFMNCAAAVAAYHTQRAVRLCLDRDEDMQITGQRHAFLARYKVGCTKEGRIVAADLQLYNNMGCTRDLSSSVMDRALMHSDCGYRIPNMRVVGRLCKMHQASNTAFRGFGGPQGMIFADMWMERMCRELGLPAHQVMYLNMYNEGDVMPCGQRLDNCQQKACWEAVLESSEYERRLGEVEAFNKENRWRKRGISLTPTKFGISFTTKFLNQAGALVHVYTDGSVLVTHGGVEMGQGLHTKMTQIAAQALRAPVEQVFVAETSTDKVPNASPTAASASTDMYGAAVLDACQQISTRLEPYWSKMPGASFKDVANAAYLERVDLSAHGFYITPDVTGFGGQVPFNYLVYGAAVSEVELDTLTGDWHLLRTDIVMDIGNPVNPAIDIGQIEGGFVQGMGWLCIEELMWGDKQHPWIRPGHLFTKGPGTYKIPTANDIPLDFRVAILPNAPNPRAIHSSKAVGEPPFHMGACVFFALKEAVYAAREENGHPGWFLMDAPATPERLRMLCADRIATAYADPNIRPKISC